jgi:type III secretory pathway component EscS
VANGSLTALQLDAAAGLLQNQGIGISASLTQAITQYQDTALISPFLNTIQVGSANALSAGVIANLETLAANTCSAFSNSIPPTYANIGVGNAFISIGITNANIKQMSTVITAQAAVDICDNNVSKLTQAVNQAQGYAEQTSIFINSAVNSQTYLGNTFTSINSMITGSVGTINLVTTAFGSDLQNLGQLINLRNLDNFGTPLALVQQLFSVAGTVPILSVAFVNAGIAEEVVLNLTNPTASVTDSIQRAMYQALTQITGSDLSQLLQVLGVTTVGLKTAADLLNPLKLFPNSFQSLTTPTANGPVAVYVDSTGSINTQLTQLLPPYVVSSLV